MNALETVGLVKSFGGIAATQGVSLTLPPGARHALIGPNGAGKTTFVHQLSGALTPDAGRVLLNGRDVTGFAPHRRAALGLARTFQISQLFPSLTPAQALAVAVARAPGIAALSRRARRDAIAARVAALADRFGLGDVLDRRTDALAYGQARMLDIAVALAGEPTVLLLDEPAAGIPEAERAALIAMLAKLPQDVAVLLIEHDMDLVFAFADHITVLVSGAVLTEGSPDAIRTDPRVRAVYLGAEDG